MEMRLFAIALCLFGVVRSVPIVWESGPCARQCSSRRVNFDYVVGNTYVYNYESITKLNIQNENGPQIRINADVDLSIHSGCDFVLKLRNVRLQGQINSEEYQRVLEQYPLSFSFDDGRVGSVCPSPEDTPWAVNLKKAIVSSLQVSMNNLQDSYRTKETDILGNCETTYEVVSNSWQGIIIRKQKDIRTCGNRQKAIVSLFPRRYFSQESSIRNIPIFANKYRCDLNLKENIIKSSKCVETNTFAPLVLSASPSNVETTTKITFSRQLKNIAVSAPVSIYRHNLLFASAPHQEKEDVSQTTEILRSMCSDIQNEIKSNAADKFEQLVTSVRQLSYESASRFYQTVANKQLCPSQKLEDIYVDALISAASEASIRLIGEKVFGKDISTMKSTYLSMMLAFANQPTAGSVKAAAELMEKKSTPRQMILGLSALIHNYCNENKEQCQHNADVKRAINAMKQKLSQKCRSENAEEESEIVVALKAIRNIGKCGDATNTLLECAVETSNNKPIRIAAIEALKNNVCNQNVKQRLLTILKNGKSSEVRIVAYRALLACPTSEMIKQIIEMLNNEESKQVGSYIQSHMNNLKKSSSPVKAALRDLLMKENIPEKFQHDIRKYSQNFELSHFFDQWGFGAVLRSDLVYGDSAIPASFRAKVAIPFYEKHFEVVEFGFRHNAALQNQLQTFFNSKHLGKDFTKTFGNLMNKAQEFFSTRSNEISGSRFRRALSMFASNQQHIQGSMFMRVDGKDILYINDNDMKSFAKNDVNDFVNNFDKHWNNLVNNINGDRAFAISPVDTQLQIPTSNGMHVNVDLKLTAVLGSKIENGKVVASYASKSEVAVTFGMKSPKSGHKWVAHSNSALKFQTKLENKNGRPSSFMFVFPDEEIFVAQLKSSMKIMENDKERSVQSPGVRQLSGCTKSFNKILGTEACIKMDIPSKFLDFQHVMNCPWNFRYSVKRSDKEMKGWEFSLLYPAKNDREVYEYKIGFNTPGSRIKRELSTRVKLINRHDGNKGIQFSIRTPVKSMEAVANGKYQNNELTFNSWMTVDQSKKFNVDVAVQQQLVRNKMEFKPRVMIQINNQEKINLKGNVQFETGNKAQVVFDLRSDNKEVLKGSIIKDSTQSNRGNVRFSVDCSANLAGNSMRMFGSLDKSQKLISHDIRVDYQMKNGQKQHMKFVSKLQDLGTSSLMKVNSFAEATFTECPQYDIHISWNLLNKPSEHCENEVIIMYGNQFKDPNKKISFLQVSKMNKQAKQSSSSEHLLNMNIGPMKREYELQAKSQIENGETPKMKFEFSGKEKKQSKEMKASFEYSHMSRVPLRLSVNAQLQVGSLTLRYSDKLEEVGRNNYVGNTIMQYNKHSCNINYNYKKKSDSTGKVHQFDFEVKTQAMRYPTHHQGLLRMSPSDFEVRSKLNHAGSSMWDCHTSLSRVGKSKVYIDTPMFTGKAETNPWSRSGLHNIELIGKTFPLKHQSDLQLQHNAVTFNTKTNYKGKQLSLNSYLSKASSRVTLDTHPMNARFEWNSAASPMNGNFEIRSKLNPTYHKTTVYAEPGKIELNSKTQIKGNNIANIDARFLRNARSTLNIETPHFVSNSEAVLFAPHKIAKVEIRGKRNQYVHKTELNFDSKNCQINSQTRQNQATLMNLNALLSRNSKSNINFETRNMVSKLEAEPFAQTRTAVIKIEHRPTQAKHISELRINPQAWTVTSTTERYGKPLVSVNGKLSGVSHLKISTHKADGTIEVHPRYGNIEIIGKSYPFSHKSSWNKQPQSIVFNSKTSRNNQQMYSLESQLSRQAKSFLKLNTNKFDGNFEMNPYTERRAKWEIVSKPNLYSHNSEILWTPKQQITINSKTLKRGQNVASIHSILSKVDKSHLRVTTNPWDATFEVHPFASIKTAKLSFQGKKSPLSHVTEVSYQPNRQTTITSKTEVRNGNTHQLDATLSRFDRSHLKLNSNSWNTLFSINPYSRVKEAEIEYNRLSGTPFSHSTKVIYDPLNHAIINSRTTRNNKQLWNVNSQISRVQPSHLKIQLQPCDASVEIDPHSSVKSCNLVYSGRNNAITHSTQLKYMPRQYISLNSQTERSGRPFASLSSLLSRNQPSHITINTSPYTATLKVHPFASKKTLICDFHNKQSQLTHNTNVEYVPSSTVTISSITKRNNNPILSVNSLLNRKAESHLNFDSNKYTGRLAFNPYGSIRTGEFKIDCKSTGFKHQTSASLNPHEINVKSISSRQGAKILHLDSVLSTKRPSNIEISTSSWTSKVKANPYGSDKYVNWQLNENRIPINHDTKINCGGGSVVIKSSTQHSGKNLLNIDSTISNNQKSYINLIHPHLQSEIEVNPFGPSKYGKLNFDWKRYALKHNTECNLNRNQYSLNSNTQYRNAKVYDFGTNINRVGHSEVRLDCPLFNGKVLVNPRALSQSGKLLDINYLAKHANNRRILCAVSYEPVSKNSITVSMSFDADKNPQNKFEATISGDKHGSTSRFNLEGTFNGEKIECPMSMDQDIFRGPHELSCTYRSQQNEYNVHFKHSIENGEIKCNLKATNNGQQLLNVVNNDKYQRNSNEMLVSGKITIDSTAKWLNGFEVGVQYDHKFSYDGNRVNAEFRSKLPGDKPVIAQLKMFQKETELNINALCETPIYDFRRQELTLNSKFDRSNGKIEGKVTTSSGKTIEINGNYEVNRNDASASLRTESDFQFVPEIKINGKVENEQQKKALFSAEVNSDKIFEVLGSLNFKSVHDFNSQASIDSKWTPYMSVNSRGQQSSGNTDYEMDVKKDAENVLTAKWKGQKERNGYSYKGSMEVADSPVASIDLQMDGSGMNYQANYKGPLRPVSVTYKQSRNGGEEKNTAEICAPNCFSVNWILQDKSSRYRKDQFFSASIRNHESSSEYSFDYSNSFSAQNVVNKMTVNLNGAKYGYLLNCNNNRRQSNFVASLMTPQRKIELNGKSEDDGDQTKTTVNFLPFAINEPDNKFTAELTHKHISTRSGRQLNTKLQMSHAEWGQPMTASFDYRSEMSSAQPMKMKAMIDCGKGIQKQIIFESKLENVENNPHNKSLTLYLYNGDRQQMDTKAILHFAQQRDVISTGINWRWLSRQRQMKTGYHSIHIYPEQNSFSLFSYCPFHDIKADGKYQTSDNRLNVEANISYNGEERNARASLDFNNICGEAQLMKEPATLLRKFHGCINTEGDRMLEISSESWINNDKSVDASLTFDKRAPKSLKLHLHWNPYAWNNFVYNAINYLKEVNLNTDALNDLTQEIAHKASWMQSTFTREYYRPWQTKVANEWYKMCQEMEHEMKPLMNALRRFSYYLPDMSGVWEQMCDKYQSAYTRVAEVCGYVADEVMRRLTRSLTSLCSGNNDCYSLVYAYERNGYEGLLQEMAKLSQKYRRSAHQYYYKVNGNVRKIINSFPNYWQQFNSALNSVYYKLANNQYATRLASFFADAAESTAEVMRRATESATDVAEAFGSVLMKNDDFCAIVNAIKEIAKDLQMEFKNVNWKNIGDLCGQMIEFVASPKNLFFNTKLVTYNMDAGEVTLVMKSPVRL